MILRFALTSVCLCQIFVVAFAQIQNGGIYSDGPIWIQVLHNYDLGKQMELHVLDFGYGWNGESNNTTCYPHDGTTTGVRLFKGSTLIHDYGISCVGTHAYIDWPIPGTLTPGDDYRFHMFYDYRPNTTCCADYYSVATPNFTIGKGPDLILPQDGGSYPVDLTFHWNPNIYDQSYQIAVFNDPNFSHSCTNGVSNGVPAIYETDILDTFYQVPQGILAPGTTYNYIVTAKQFGLCFRNFGSFTTEPILPIGLIDFNAKVFGHSVILDWNTSFEDNNSYFLIEHSINGITFNTIEKILSKGNSIDGNSYNSTHIDPFTGVNYYRLTQYDFNGENSKSPIISVNLLEDSQRLKLVPNIVEDAFKIEGPEMHPMSYEIYGINGKLVSKKKELDLNRFLQLEAITSGIYFFRVIGDSYSETFRFIKL